MSDEWNDPKETLDAVVLAGDRDAYNPVCGENKALLQIEGCITMGLGYALSEEIRFSGGEIHDTNFDTYQIPRFSWVPKIESVILDLDEEPAQGGGEPAIITMGAVVANAVFDATGARLFRLPMTPDRVKEALQKA